MHSKRRINLALGLLTASFVLNVGILVSGEVAPGWPITAVILLAAAGVTLLAERRPY